VAALPSIVSPRTGTCEQIHDVAGVAREGPLVQLAAVPAVDEELDGPAQSLDRAREAARAAAQARQVVPHLGVVGLAGGRLALAGRDGVACSADYSILLPLCRC
jgi:hypothetical protein